MNVLDLFSGLGGWSAAFRERGHNVLTLDNDSKFKPDICKDILEVDSIDDLGSFDIVLASPPCNCFSIASCYLYWIKGSKPPRPKPSKIGIVNHFTEIARHTFDLLEDYNPKFYVIENPRGMMRKVIRMPVTTIAYCQYGFPYMKPTDLWGKLPPSFVPKMCKNKRTDDESAPRGTAKGIQAMTKDHLSGKDRFNGIHTTQIIDHISARHSWDKWSTSGIRRDVKDASARAFIPYGLSLAMCLAAEHDLNV